MICLGIGVLREQIFRRSEHHSFEQLRECLRLHGRAVHATAPSTFRAARAAQLGQRGDEMLEPLDISW